MQKAEFQEKVRKINKELKTLLAEFNVENGEVPMVIFAAGVEDDYAVEHYASMVHGTSRGLSLLLSGANAELTKAVVKAEVLKNLTDH
ncbi:hypothetical protein ACEE08_11565 [Staphylococcus rostri]